jgi:hypothetical protein
MQSLHPREYKSRPPTPAASPKGKEVKIKGSSIPYFTRTN